MAAMTAVTQVPMFAPSTMAIPSSGGIVPVEASPIAMPMTAALLCSIAVRQAPAASPHRLLVAAWSRNQRNSPLACRAGPIDCITAMPHSTRANPATARLMNCSCPEMRRQSSAARQENAGSSPSITAAAHRHSAAVSSGADSELICSPISSVVRQVPILLPRMMPSVRA
ncbi:hypothetical protein D3C73_1204740 [compost metagenome]